MYNGYGSVARDRAEGNSNSIDFKAFKGGGGAGAARAGEKRKRRPVGGKGPGDADVPAKRSLSYLAEYERVCLKLTMERLDGEGVSAGTANAVKLFVGVTNLFEQIHVARDVGTWTRTKE